MPDRLLATAFGASLNVGAMLFGVFGFLYTVYAMYSSLATPEQPARAPICNVLKRLCRALAILLSYTALLTLYSLYLLHPAGMQNIFLAVGFVVPLLAMVGISIWMSFLTTRPFADILLRKPHARPDLHRVFARAMARDVLPLTGTRLFTQREG